LGDVEAGVKDPRRHCCLDTLIKELRLDNVLVREVRQVDKLLIECERRENISDISGAMLSITEMEIKSYSYPLQVVSCFQKHF